MKLFLSIYSLQILIFILFFQYLFVYVPAGFRDFIWWIVTLGGFAGGYVGIKRTGDKMYLFLLSSGLIFMSILLLILWCYMMLASM